MKIIWTILIFVLLGTLGYLPRITYAATSTPYMSEFTVPTSNSGPLAITVSANGDVWFTESNASKVAHLDPASSRIMEFPIPNKTGELWGILVSKEGTVWFTDYASGVSNYTSGGFAAGGKARIWSFDPASSVFQQRELANGSFPMRLAEDDTGRLWLTEFLGNKLGVFDPKLEEFKEYPIPTPNSGPADITISRDGRVWFTEAYANSIAVFDPLNESFREFPFQELFSPVGIALDESGRVWVADHGSSRIGVFNPTDRTLQLFPTSPPSHEYPVSLPNGLLVSAAGEVWFAEHLGNRIGRIDPRRNTLTEYDIPSPTTSDALWLAEAPDGRIWFTEYSTNKIGVIDPHIPLPFSLSISAEPLKLNQGELATATLIFTSQEPSSQRLTLFALSSSIKPNDVLVSFSSNPIDMAASEEVTVVADLQFGQDMKPGRYVLGLGAQATSGVRHSVFLSANVSVTEAWVVDPWTIALPIAAVSILAFVLYVARSRPPSRKEREPFSRVLGKHKVVVLIAGIAFTNLAAAGGGGIHLLLLNAGTRTIPFSNATLAAYGAYAFFLDLLALLFGILTAATILLAWRPRKRIAFSVLLTTIVISSAVVLAGTIQHPNPSLKCDVLIRNSVFSGGYYPATISIQAGSTVTWCNDGQSLHADTVTSDSGLFNSGTIAQGASWSFTFAEQGEYGYHSLIHFWMRGVVVVIPHAQTNSDSLITPIGFGSMLEWRSRMFETRERPIATVLRLPGHAGISIS